MASADPMPEKAWHLIEKSDHLCSTVPPANSRSEP
jgi:hypothetical protein